jgi:biotin transport system substrate-specific component
LVGVPVFAKFRGGLSMIIDPSFGFILSFILAAFIIGKIVEKKKSVPIFIIASLVGMIVNYFIGTNWLYFAYKLWAAAPEGFTYKLAWLWMVVPLPKDIILAVFAGIMAHRLEKSVLSKGQFKHLKRVV